jgi:hypothetical protein
MTFSLQRGRERVVLESLWEQLTVLQFDQLTAPHATALCPLCHFPAPSLNIPTAQNLCQNPMHPSSNGAGFLIIL